MSGYSKVGTSGVYEAGDQRNYKASEEPRPERYEEGVGNSHLPNDSSMLHIAEWHRPTKYPGADMFHRGPEIYRQPSGERRGTAYISTSPQLRRGPKTIDYMLMFVI